MIPALLTCGYVVYLYHTLKAASGRQSPESPSPASCSTHDLVTRLGQLRERLAAIQKRLESGSPTS